MATHKQIKVAPSILSADFSRLGEAVTEATDAGAVDTDAALRLVTRADDPPPTPTPCVSTHVPQGTGPVASAQRTFELNQLAALGVRTIRQDFLWHQIEPAPGELVFDAYDRLVDEAAAVGIEIIALLAYGNPWATAATEDDRFYPPDDPADFAAFAAATATHFRGRVTRYEIWNEANAGFRFFKPNVKGDPAAFARIVDAAARAVHGVDAEARVALGGLFYHGQFGLIMSAPEFLAAAVDAAPTMVEAIDAVAIHPYPQYPPSVGPEIAGNEELPFADMLAAIRQVFADRGLVSPPIWITEVGWPVAGPVTETLQAGYLARSFLLAAAEHIELWCVYTLLNGRDEGSAIPEGDFGLLWYYDDAESETPAAREKMAFATLRDVFAQSGDWWLEGPVPTDALGAAEVRGLRFGQRGGASTIVALWSVADAVPLSLSVAPNVGSVVRHTLDGADPTALERAAGGPVTLEVGPLPALLELTPAP